jgi:hypothetical protein
MPPTTRKRKPKPQTDDGGQDGSENESKEGKKPRRRSKAYSGDIEDGSTSVPSQHHMSMIDPALTSEYSSHSQSRSHFTLGDSILTAGSTNVPSSGFMSSWSRANGIDSGSMPAAGSSTGPGTARGGSTSINAGSMMGGSRDLPTPVTGFFPPIGTVDGSISGLSGIMSMDSNTRSMRPAGADQKASPHRMSMHAGGSQGMGWNGGEQARLQNAPMMSVSQANHMHCGDRRDLEYS